MKARLLAAWSAVILLVFIASPAHRLSPAELVSYFLPGEATAQSVAGEWLMKMADALSCLLVGTAILGTGTAVSRILAGQAPLLRSWFLGLAPLALTGLGLGLTGLWIKGVLIAVAAVSAATLAFQRPKSGMPARGAFIAILPCLLSLPGALAPEIAFDSLRYHLALPNLFLFEHRIFHVERFLFSAFPSSMEMLYGFCLSLGSEGAAKMLDWTFLPISGYLLYGLVQPILPARPAILLTACFCAMPFLGSLAVFSNVDLPLMAVELAAFSCVWSSLNRKAAGLWLSAGWLFGTAMGFKYLGLFALAGAVLALPLAGTGFIRPFLVRTLPLALVLPGAWLAKNILMTGNPVFPYLANLFSSFDVEAETIQRHLAYAANWGAEHPLWSAWVTVFPIALSRGTYDGLSEALSPVIFLLSALAVLYFPSQGSRRWLLFVCAILWTVWASAGGGIFRFLVPFYPCAFLLAAILISQASQPTRPLAIALSLFLAAQIPPLLASQYRLSFAPMGAALGMESRKSFLDRVLPPAGRYFPAMKQADIAAKPGRLLVLGDPKAYYAGVRCRTEFEFAPPLLLHLSAISGNSGRMRIRLKQAGIRAVLYRAEAAVSAARMCDCIPARLGTLERYQRFWAEYMEPAWSGEYPAENNYYQCYRLRDKPGRLDLPKSELWFNLPGTENLTGDADRALAKGKTKEAAELARMLASRYPDFAPALYRVVLTAPESADASRARRKLGKLGWGELGE